MKRELSVPLTVPRFWTFADPKLQSRTKVKAQTWFRARAEAAIVLGVEPGQLTLIGNPLLDREQ